MTEMHASTVAEFLRALLVTEPHFPQGYALFFRGQADATWGLVPSIRRRLSWERLGGAEQNGLECTGDLVSSSDDALRVVEERLDLVLRQVINRMGLPPYLKNGDNLRAFGQHIGLPTRFLDWTRSPWTAAYFAASGAASKYPPTGDLAVFALSTAFIEFSGETPSVQWATAEGAASPTLLAQQGRLLRVDVVDLMETIRLAVKPIGWAPSITDEATLSNWAMNLTLPWTLAPQLLELLQRQEIHAATMFPNQHGIAELVPNQAQKRTQ